MPNVAASARGLVAGKAKLDSASQSSHCKNHCFGQALQRYAAVVIDNQGWFRWRGGEGQLRASWHIPHNMQLVIGEPQFTLREVSALLVRKDDQPRRARRCGARSRQDGMQRSRGRTIVLMIDQRCAGEPCSQQSRAGSERI